MSFETVEIEYETIVLQSDEEVFFRIDGEILRVPRDKIVEFDLEGRLYLYADDAKNLGLV